MKPALHLGRRDVLSMTLTAVLAGPSVAKSGTRDAFVEVFADPDMSSDQKLNAMLAVLVAALQTDRAFIYMRDPDRGMTAYTHLATTRPDWGHFALKSWSREPNPDTLNEPMLKSAFRSDKVHFVDDIETAPDGMINRALERSYFGHRALIHAPLHHQTRFYGILETAMKDTPRIWSAQTQDLIHWMQPRVARACSDYLSNPT